LPADPDELMASALHLCIANVAAALGIIHQRQKKSAKRKRWRANAIAITVPLRGYHAMRRDGLQILAEYHDFSGIR
jgi:hypothetical protein